MQPIEGSATLADVIFNLDRSNKEVLFYKEGQSTKLSWKSLASRAIKDAARLQALGIEPNDKVGLLGITSPELLTALMGVWLTGATAVVLSLPLRIRSLEELIDSLMSKIKTAEIKVVLIQDDLAEFVPETKINYIKISDLQKKFGESFQAVKISPEDLAIIQFTSGSTADPKGVMLTHEMLINHINSIVISAEFDSDNDKVVSWLPLYHDMGLIGLFLVPMATGSDLIMESPQEFLKDPPSWLYLISENRATATAGPNFSYALMTRVLKNNFNYDLSSLRIALNGAEPINPDSVEAFVESGRKSNLNKGAVFPAFGMAEATLAVTFPKPGTGLEVDSVDLDYLEANSFAKAPTETALRSRRFAKLGKPIHGFEIKIVDVNSRQQLAKREVGEVLIKGNSITPGYYNNKDATEKLFENGWLRSGDLGYLTEDSQLVICGRIKDVIIVGGRNVYPEDIEWAVSKIDGVRPGNVIAFGEVDLRGKERVVVVAEVKESKATLKSQIASKVLDVCGVPVKDVVLLDPGSLPKTSSGKLQRAFCKELYKAGKLTSL
jgi:fatty-acyl-CoA synthase